MSEEKKSKEAVNNFVTLISKNRKPIFAFANLLVSIGSKLDWQFKDQCKEVAEKMPEVKDQIEKELDKRTDENGKVIILDKEE